MSSPPREEGDRGDRISASARVRPPETGRAERALGAGFVAALILGIGALWTPSGSVVVCPLLLLTGLPCPTCGITRSVSATLHGQLSEALRFHPLGPVVVLLAVVVLASSLAQLARRPWLDRLTPWGYRVFFVLLGFEILFVWPFHLRDRLAAGWAAAWEQGMLSRLFHMLLELFHAF